MIWIKSLLNDHLFNLVIKYFKLSASNELMMKYLENSNHHQILENIINTLNKDNHSKLIINKDDSLDKIKQALFENNINDSLIKDLDYWISWFHQNIVVDNFTKTIVASSQIYNKKNVDNNYIELAALLINFLFIKNGNYLLNKVNLNLDFLNNYQDDQDMSLSEENLKRFDYKKIFNYYEYIINALMVLNLNFKKQLFIKIEDERIFNEKEFFIIKLNYLNDDDREFNEYIIEQNKTNQALVTFLINNHYLSYDEQNQRYAKTYTFNLKEIIDKINNL